MCVLRRGQGGAARHAGVRDVPHRQPFDLAEIAGRGRFLHVIALDTRLSRCMVFNDKQAPTIFRTLLSHWIYVYGECRVVLSDSGREFHNVLLRSLAEGFNIRADVTAGQSAWSNGVCERHNGVVKHMVTTLASYYPAATLQELLDHACFAKNALAVYGCASPFQLVTGSQPRIPSVLSDDLSAMQEGHLPTEADLARTVAMLAASRPAFSRAEASESVRRTLNRRVQGDPGRVYQPGDIVRYWEQSELPARRGLHGPATVVSRAGRVVRLHHGEPYKTFNAADVEPFSAPDPVASQATDPGVVGAALSALRHAAGPASDAGAAVSLAAALPRRNPSPPAPERRRRSVASVPRHEIAEAVALVVGEAAIGDCDSVVPDATLSAGAALAATAGDDPAATRPSAVSTSGTAAHRDKGFSALVAHSVFIAPQEMRARNEVPASAADTDFDAAKEAQPVAWMTHGAYEEVPLAGHCVLSML